MLTGSSGVVVPSPNVSCDVHWSRLSPSSDHRSSDPDASSLTLTEVWFLVENVRLATADEMRVVAGSPRKRAALPARPIMAPLEGL